MRILLLLLVFSVTVGCSDKDGSPVSNGTDTNNDNAQTNGQTNGQTNQPNADAPITYHRDIAPLLAKNCVGCHREGAIGPHQFEAYEDVSALGALIKSATGSRTMPPYQIDNSGSCGTFDVPTLTDTEIAMIADWVDAGMPEGNPDDGPGPFEAPLGLEDVGVELIPGEAYTPDDAVTDDYRCFVVDNPSATDVMITGFEVAAGAPDLVHHVILFDLLDNANVATVEALDAAEAGSGYTCYGGPGVTQTNILAGWAPGIGVTDYPAGTGIRLEAGRKYVIQVHYNLAAAPEPDLTSVRLRTAEPGEVTEAFMFPFADQAMVLPPGGDDVEAVYDFSLPFPISFSVWGALPHMHERGRSMEIQVRRDDEYHCAARVPEWDFNWQNLYFYDRPLLVERGDMIRVRCKYDLSQDSELVGWGDGTQDEMCFGVIYVSPGADPDGRELSDFEVVDDHDGTEFLGAQPTVATRAHLGGSGEERPHGIVQDDAGNAYVLVSQRGSVDLGNGPTNFDGEGAWVARLSPDGTMDWVFPIDGPGQQTGWQLRITPSDTLAVVMTTTRSLTIATETVTTTEAESFIVELGMDGSFIGLRRYGQPGEDWTSRAAFGSDGSLVVVGYFGSSFVFAGTTIEAMSHAILRWNPDGSEAWATTFTATGAVWLNDIAIDAAGNVALATLFWDSATVAGTTYAIETEESDALAIFVSADGSTMSAVVDGLAWGDGFMQVEATATGFLLAGSFAGTPTLLGQATFSGGPDAYLMQFDPTGNLLWSTMVGGVGADTIWALDVAPNGEISATIDYTAPLQLMDGSLYAGGLYDLGLLRFDPAGTVLSARRLAGAGHEGWGNVLATDSGALVAMLSESRTIDFGDGPQTGRGNRDVYVLDVTY